MAVAPFVRLRFRYRTLQARGKRLRNYIVPQVTEWARACSPNTPRFPPFPPPYPPPPPSLVLCLTADVYRHTYSMCRRIPRCDVCACIAVYNKRVDVVSARYNGYIRHDDGVAVRKPFLPPPSPSARAAATRRPAPQLPFFLPHPPPPPPSWSIPAKPDELTSRAIGKSIKRARLTRALARGSRPRRK